jgi:hypothetical protein
MYAKGPVGRRPSFGAPYNGAARATRAAARTIRRPRWYGAPILGPLGLTEMLVRGIAREMAGAFSGALPMRFGRGRKKLDDGELRGSFGGVE